MIKTPAALYSKTATPRCVKLVLNRCLWTIMRSLLFIKVQGWRRAECAQNNFGRFVCILCRGRKPWDCCLFLNLLLNTDTVYQIFHIGFAIFSDFQIPCEVCPTFFLISRPHVRFYLIFSDFQITHRTCPFSDFQIPCEVFALILFWFPDQMWEMLVRSATRAFGRVSAAVQKRNNSRNNNSPPRHWLPRPGYWI